MNDPASRNGIQRPPASPMRSGLFKFGAAATVVWLAAGLALMVFASNRSNVMAPNEWGDAFAGLFAPVAFLWLVLGFLQQGTELQLSTRALELQVTELKNSVEQQQALVEVSRRQAQSMLDEQERSQAAARERQQPRFVVNPTRKLNVAGMATWDFQILNEGESVSSVTISFVPDISGKAQFFPHLRRGNDIRFTLRAPVEVPEGGVVVNLSFVDVSQNPGCHRFIIEDQKGLGVNELRVGRLLEEHHVRGVGGVG